MSNECQYLLLGFGLSISLNDEIKLLEESIGKMFFGFMIDIFNVGTAFAISVMEEMEGRHFLDRWGQPEGMG